MAVLQFRGAFATLALSIVGSAVLPVPYAFRCTGVGLGAALALSVALANAYTCELMLGAVAATPATALPRARCTYEALAHVSIGPRGRSFARAGLVTLLLGSLCGNIIILVEVLDRAVALAGLGHVDPNWVILWVTPVLLAASLPRRLGQLERASGAGVAILFVIAMTVVLTGAMRGLPALRGGGERADEPWVSLGTRTPSAVGVLGYAMYLHPQLMPVLADMAPGKAGIATAKAASRATVCFATLLYLLVGTFGFGAYGDGTERNILDNLAGVNKDGNYAAHGQQAAVVALTVATTAYLALGFPMAVLPLRESVEQIFWSAEENGPEVRWHSSRNVGVTSALVIGSACVAWVLPTSAGEIVFAFTGATGVCLVCYIMPVWIFWATHKAHSRRAGGPAAAAAVLGLDMQDAERAGSVVMPLLVADHERGARDGVAEVLALEPLKLRQKFVMVSVCVMGCVLSLFATWSVFLDGRKLSGGG